MTSDAFIAKHEVIGNTLRRKVKRHVSLSMGLQAFDKAYLSALCMHVYRIVFHIDAA